MAHPEETEPASARVSDSAFFSPGDATDAGYAQRMAEARRDRLASAGEPNVGYDEEDMDSLALYGEQAVHNFPDVHADWGDDTARTARLAKMKAAAAERAFMTSPDAGDGTSAWEPSSSGWHTEYRAGLERALGAARESKEMMRNLQTIRQRKRDIDAGVDIGHLKGTSAKEANAEWEKQRIETREAERRRRGVAEARNSARPSEREKENRTSGVAGLPSLPDFLKPRVIDLETDRDDARVDGLDSEAAEAAARALAGKRGEWIAALNGETERWREDEKTDPFAPRDLDTSETSETSETSISREARGTFEARVEVEVEDDARSRGSAADDPAASFFDRFTSLSPSRRARGSKTESADFWEREMWGGDDFDVDDDLVSAEEEMARLCAAEISNARRASAGEE